MKIDQFVLSKLEQNGLEPNIEKLQREIASPCFYEP